MIKKSLAVVVFLWITIGTAGAELQPESIKLLSLPADPSPHWVWVADIAFHFMLDGRTYLVDGDSGKFLGMLSTGFAFSNIAIPRDYKELYSAEIYYSRGSRGERTDVVSIYDSAKLAPVAEVVIPSKRSTNMPTLVNSGLTDDGRFLMVYNFTPAASVSVVDVESRKFVGEIDTPGCALVYPAGKRRFVMLCGDGSLLTVRLDEKGEASEQKRSSAFFDPTTDPLTEKGVRYKDQWLFISFNSVVQSVDASGSTPVFAPGWSLLTDEDRAESWRVGGIQLSAVHERSGMLYVVMHQGGKDTHKDPGTEVWAFDLGTKRRTRRIKTKNLVTSVQVTKDDEPLLFTVFIGSPSLDVYDARSGEYLRTVGELGLTPTLLQTP